MPAAEEETALAVMDDDGWGSAITTAPVTPSWRVTVELTRVPGRTADDVLNRVTAQLAGTGARAIWARADQNTEGNE